MSGAAIACSMIFFVKIRAAVIAKDVRVAGHVDNAQLAVRPGFETDIENNGDALAVRPSPVWLLFH
jgi:hypothetical protein